MDGSAAEAATASQASAEQVVAGQDVGADGDAQYLPSRSELIRTEGDNSLSDRW